MRTARAACPDEEQQRSALTPTGLAMWCEGPHEAFAIKAPALAFTLLALTTRHPVFEMRGSSQVVCIILVPLRVTLEPLLELLQQPTNLNT